MLHESGGFSAYFASFSILWKMVPSKESVFTAPITMSIARFCLLLGMLALGTGAAGAALFARSPDPPELHAMKRFTWVWIAPGFLFFTFVFIRSVNSGYTLVLLPPVFAWLGHWATGWYEAAKRADGIAKGALLPR